MTKARSVGRRIVYAVVVAVIACQDNTAREDAVIEDSASLPKSVATAVAPGRYACPDQPWQGQVVAPAIVAVAEDVQNALGPGAKVLANNEVHDCQVFIKSGATANTFEYGSLMTLWILTAAELGDYATPTLVAGIKNEGGAYTQGTGAMSLSIPEGLSCVFVRGKGNNDSNWRAWIVARPTDGCAGVNVRDHDSLYVHRAKQDVDRIVAGRWLDAGTSYYPSLQCGKKRFCVIGAPNEDLPTGIADEEYGPHAEGDRQRLAKKDENGDLVPSGLIGEIDVKTKVQNRHLKSHFKNQWVELARVTFKDLDPMASDTAARRQYAVKLKIGTKASDLQTKRVFIFKMRWDSTATKNEWNARYETLSGFKGDTIRAKYVTSTAHAGTGVRWRWSSRDEGVWAQCAVGCCTIGD